MALVQKGTIEINGVRVDCMSWDVSGGPTSEGKFGTAKTFLGYAQTPAVFEIKMSLLQATGKPRIDFANLPPGFTLIRNFVGGARHQFTGCIVSNADVESASETEYTSEIVILAAEKVEQ